MAITYNWNFSPLESYPTASGQTDVVFLVHWQAYGSTGSYQRSLIGTQPVTYDSGSAFVPFGELTYQIVYDWVSSSMDMSKVEENIAQQIKNQINPPVLIQQAPWL
jgi:hypothetical protein